jgi:GT2 family glycosyltransferase
MGKPLPRVAVVIPNWNGADDLRDCLASLRSQRGVELEPLVIDNGSTDGSVELLRDEGVKHVALASNTGFARAVNLGVARTGSPLVVVLNADTIHEPDAFARLAEELESDPGLGGVQPRILELQRGSARDRDDPGTPAYSLGQALTSDGRARELGIGLPQGQLGPDPREIFGVCGAACMFRRSALEELGGYDERYFAFYEDVDLNVRARIAGWTFRLVPGAVVWHVGNAAWQAGFEKPEAENARLVARNRIWTRVKFMPVRSLPRIVVVEAGSLLVALGQRRLRATLAGKLAALKILPALLGERRDLARRGDPALARRWLGEVR